MAPPNEAYIKVLSLSKQFLSTKVSKFYHMGVEFRSRNTIFKRFPY